MALEPVLVGVRVDEKELEKDSEAVLEGDAPRERAAVGEGVCVGVTVGRLEGAAWGVAEGVCEADPGPIKLVSSRLTPGRTTESSEEKYRVREGPEE